MTKSDARPGRFLIVAPLGKDASLAAELLQKSGLTAKICPDLLAVARELGDDTNSVVIAEEALVTPQIPALLTALERQPAWSDIPVIILANTGHGEEGGIKILRLFGPKANVTLVERPLRAVTLISTLEVALRARTRQREVRDLIAQRESAFASISDAFTAIDADWRYTFVNARAAEYAGRPREEMIGRTVWEVYPEARESDLHRAALRAKETRQPQIFEKYYERWQSWLETHVYPASDGGVVVFRANVDKRKEAAAELREKDVFVRLLLDTIAEGFYGVDGDGVTTICNAAFLRMLGFNEESEVIGKKLHDVIHHSRADGSPYPKVECHIYRTAQTGQPAHADDELFFRIDGTSFPVEYWAFPIMRDGELRGAVTTFIDITERRQAQIALQQAKQEAEEANNAKDQFLAMLSHELRTPLTPVLMTIAALQQQPQIAETFREDLDVLQRNVELESRLIDDLLDLTRIRHGKLELHRDAVDVHAAVEHAITISAGEIAEKHLEIVRDLGAREHYCWGDAARLQQVFWNLLKNSVKFTPPGGQIKIETRNDDPQQIIVRISDTGIGIAPELMPRIFDAFEQGGREMTSRFGGLGLGLAISRRVVNLHQGTLEAESAGEDRGSTFVVTLKAMATSLLDHSSAYTPEPASSTGAMRVLLVEDHADTAGVLRRMLTQTGYTVTHASNLAEARHAAAQDGFDLLISDLALPDGSGLDLMREFRDLYRPIGIALSGFGTVDDVAASMAAGFAEHLTKPVEWQRLRNAINRLTSHLEPLATDH
ncbi:MAG: ATP-binding protein [Verrucomicrobiota bacterium]|nr:ATP-binding protein [Verrucomicrobiota bacterium]